MKTIHKAELCKGLNPEKAEKAWKKMFEGVTKIYPAGITFTSVETAEKFVADFTRKYNRIAK